MAENRAAWGIDIGQSALKAIKVRYVESTGQMVAEAFDYIQFPKILSQPDAIPEEIVPEAMQTFLSRNNLKGDLVGISVPGQSALARFIQLPPVESSKLHEIVKYEARQQIPFALEDVIWDYQPLGAGMEESGFLLDAEVGLFAMKKDQVYRQLQPYNNAKVEVELIQIAPLCLYNVLSVDELGIRADSGGEAGDDHYIVLDMGCDNTTLLVSNGYNVWIRNVPIGGNHFTRALTKEMKLSFAKAEHLKCNATKSPDPRAVFQALRPIFNDYVSEIQRSIGYFSSVSRQAKIMKVIGVGNGFKLAGLQKFLQQNLQYEVVRPDTFQGLAGDTVLNSPLFADNLLSFAVPYGLSLQALGLSRVHTSLLPPEIKSARKIRKKKPWVVSTAAAMLLGATFSTALNANAFQTVNTEAFTKAEKEATDYASEVSSLGTKYTAETGNFTATQERLNSFLVGRRDMHWIETFNAISDCLPRDPDGAKNLDEEISLRNQISLTEISSDKVVDLTSWYDGLSPQQKTFMSLTDKATGPSGEGYVFTLRGKHWHHEETNPTGQGVLYVVHNFLRNLQEPVVQIPGYPERDITRMGISHATIVTHAMEVITMNAAGKINTNASRFANPKGGRGILGTGLNTPMNEPYRGASGSEGASGLPMGAAAEDLIELHETSFVVQFALKYVAPAERTEIVVEAAASEEAPVEGEESAVTPEAAVSDPAATTEPAATEPAAAENPDQSTSE